MEDITGLLGVNRQLFVTAVIFSRDGLGEGCRYMPNAEHNVVDATTSIVLGRLLEYQMQLHVQTVALQLLEFLSSSSSDRGTAMRTQADTKTKKD